MLVMNTLEAGMQLNPHAHDDFDQLAYIIDGHANYYIDGVAHLLSHLDGHAQGEEKAR